MVKQLSLSRIEQIDWDFPGVSSESPFSPLHWYPGRFASQIPAAMIGLLSRPGDLVLDPFAGSGTTLVEAQRLRRRSIGIELSPAGQLVAAAKTLARPASDVERSIERIQVLATSVLSAPRRRIEPGTPPSVQVDKWYVKSVSVSLTRLWRAIDQLRGTDQLLARFAFSSILLRLSRETRHWGYVCDNSSPMGDHGGDVGTEFTKALAKLGNAYRERDAEYAAQSTIEAIPSSLVLGGDARVKLREVEEDSVDLVMTSPPYFGVCDYVKAQRLSMEWFSSDIEEHRRLEIGARSKRHRQAAATEYASDLAAVLGELKRTMKASAALVLVLGQSKQRAAAIPEVRRTLDRVGFSVLKDLRRSVSQRRRQTPSILNEHILVCSK